MLIVNADDFGLSKDVNEAIASAFGAGVVSSTTILANAPAFDHACDLAAAKGFGGAVGIHLNVTEGAPLTRAIRHEPLFCDDVGRFRFTRGSHYILRPMEIRAVREEFTEQIRRCRARGISLTHADSHHHCHTEPAMLFALVPVLRAERIPFLRLSDNVRPTGTARRIYKNLFNAAIGLCRLRGADVFCDLNGFVTLGTDIAHDDLVIEVMVHPTYTKHGLLVDGGAAKPLIETVKRATFGQPLFSYADVRRPHAGGR